MSQEIKYNIDDIVVEGAKKYEKAAKSGGMLMSDEQFNQIRNMSFHELERLIDELDSKHPGFRNLIGKKGTEGFRYCSEDYAPSHSERTNKAH